MLNGFDITDWTDLVQIYWPHLFVGGGAAALLSYWGTQVVSRSKVVESLSFSQAIVAGGVVSLHFEWMSFWGSLPALFLCLLLNRVLAHRSRAGMDGSQMSIYLFFVALSLLLVQWSPRVEAQHLKILFGDIVMLTRPELWGVFGASVVILIFFFFSHARLTRESFFHQLYPGSTSLCFAWANLFIVFVFVSSFGLLFSLAFLFLPTSLFAFGRSATQHQRNCVLLGLISFLCGFFVSLAFPGLQTTPSIVLSLFAACLLSSSVVFYLKNR